MILVTDDRALEYRVSKAVVRRACPTMSASELATFRVPGQMNNLILEHIFSRHTQRGDRVLDPMCSVGTTLHWGAKHGRSVHGLELIPNLVAIGRLRLEQLLPGNRNWRLEHANAFTAALPTAHYDLGIFSPPQIRLRRGPYPAGKDQIGNFTYATRAQYWRRIRALVARLGRALRPGARFITLNVNMRCQDESLYLFPHDMHQALTDCGWHLIEEVVVQRLHHFNIDRIQYEYLRTYQRQHPPHIRGARSAK